MNTIICDIIGFQMLVLKQMKLWEIELNVVLLIVSAVGTQVRQSLKAGVVTDGEVIPELSLNLGQNLDGQ